MLPLLWYIIKLEQQAKVAGGRLVYVLGNHDNMVLKGDLRYLADKYRSLQDSLGQPYNALFCKESIIGKWLASKNAVQKIGNLLFVHGGISYEFVKMGFTPEIANKIIRDNLFCEKSAYNSDAQFLFGSNGPLWYRGLVRDDEKYNPITSNQLKLILNNLKIKRIVVGHTTFDDIVNHHRGKIISVDSRDKNTGVPHLFQGYMTR